MEIIIVLFVNYDFVSTSIIRRGRIGGNGLESSRERDHFSSHKNFVFTLTSECPL
ncbi:hypothetical protein HCBG_02638 [Histoplasma capsulatum G186AR]|uniref:Uncharacterized protein n=1 Tax=Ajellomyces capsulatus (strain G186AR / H82 / ATCC MYA-2454 / RMSCC 2432) TaxID=447093 RepID=C0NH16_AJECG|nr:uncharacterized protein HCBG_02638 [Histoplasma capsulatum G186AR]EEH09101.1 hypothetical protein HCBG_02638 [Histoplasma capsulatum G186AR]